MKQQTLYSKRPNLVLGFHGCDKSVAEAVVNGGNLKESLNDYDWLGNGIYFWENNAERALQWAKDMKKTEPAVLGAVLDLGYCMDLIDSEFLRELSEAFIFLETTLKITGNPIPKNEGKTVDKLKRNLDCAVIETAHQINENTGAASYDSVRGVFWEGKELYPAASFKEKNHIQICVRNPNCIKGYFIPRPVNKNYLLP